MSSSHIQTLRAMLREEKGVILPGAPNALAARIIADLGFKAVYLTGAGLTNMHLGLPDLGFMDLSQVADHVMAIRCVIDLPLIVDIDTGFGNAVNVTHTVRILEQAGASASRGVTALGLGHSRRGRAASKLGYVPIPPKAEVNSEH